MDEINLRLPQLINLRSLFLVLGDQASRLEYVEVLKAFLSKYINLLGVRCLGLINQYPNPFAGRVGLFRNQPSD